LITGITSPEKDQMMIEKREEMFAVEFHSKQATLVQAKYLGREVYLIAPT
jgi:hypothetical protein